jgi:hypothetical protein
VLYFIYPRYYTSNLIRYRSAAPHRSPGRKTLLESRRNQPSLYRKSESQTPSTSSTMSSPSSQPSTGGGSLANKHPDHPRLADLGVDDTCTSYNSSPFAWLHRHETRLSHIPENSFGLCHPSHLLHFHLFTFYILLLLQL